jgi:hypothetical protein
MEAIMEEKWNDIDACSLCHTSPPKGTYWSEENCSMGISGFTFVFCDACSNDRRKECDEMIVKCLSDWKNRCEEQWAKDKELTSL